VCVCVVCMCGSVQFVSDSSPWYPGVTPSERDFIASMTNGLKINFVISGCRRDVDSTCALLGYYAAQSGNSSTFRDNLSATKPIGRPETSVRVCHSTLCNNPEERRFH